MKDTVASEDKDIANSSNISLFNSNSKLLFFTKQENKKLVAKLAKNYKFDNFIVTIKNDKLEAVDNKGAVHSFNAPASGAVLLMVGPASDRQVLDTVLSLWTDAQLVPPKVVDFDKLAVKEVVPTVGGLLMEELLKELNQTAADAVRLDRQIVVLREELENFRMQLSHNNFHNHVAGNLPIMGYERLPSNVSWDMGKEPQGKQLLPYPGSAITAIAFKMENKEVLENGVLIAKLQAQEDNKVLNEWRIDSKFLKLDETIHDDWIMLAVDNDIHYRYRFVDLILEWRGDEEKAPIICLTNTVGDPEAFLKTNTSDMRRATLAMRVWTGHKINKKDYQHFVLYPSELDQSQQQEIAVQLQPHKLKKSRIVVKRKFAWDMLLTEKNHLFLHPTVHGSSIAVTDLSWTSEIRGISALLCNKNLLAPSISFCLIAARDEFKEATLEKIASGEDTRSAIASVGWTTLVPGTERPIKVQLPQPETELKLYFMTSVPNKRDAHAHAWFRNLRYLV